MTLRRRLTMWQSDQMRTEGPAGCRNTFRQLVDHLQALRSYACAPGRQCRLNAICFGQQPWLKELHPEARHCSYAACMFI